jgi:hypothetical protein
MPTSRSHDVLPSILRPRPVLQARRRSLVTSRLHFPVFPLLHDQRRPYLLPRRFAGRLPMLIHLQMPIATFRNTTTDASPVQLRQRSIRITFSRSAAGPQRRSNRNIEGPLRATLFFCDLAVAPFVAEVYLPPGQMLSCPDRCNGRLDGSGRLLRCLLRDATSLGLQVCARIKTCRRVDCRG